MPTFRIDVSRSIPLHMVLYVIMPKNKLKFRNKRITFLYNNCRSNKFLNTFSFSFFRKKDRVPGGLNWESGHTQVMHSQSANSLLA